MKIFLRLIAILSLLGVLATFEWVPVEARAIVTALLAINFTICAVGLGVLDATETIGANVLEYLARKVRTDAEQP